MTMLQAISHQDDDIPADAPAPRIIPAHEAVIEVLKEQGVDMIFGYPGGAIMPIYDALEKIDHGMTHVLTASEGGAGHMATAYARASGKTGVLLVTSGPGITNAITPIADAQGDSMPMVVISGQVPTSLIGTGAFQEVDATGISRKITKDNILITDASTLVAELRRAFKTAASGRKGVVHIDIPKDIQNTMVTFDDATQDQPSSVATFPQHYREAAQMMREARRPIFYVGGGVIHAGEGACRTMQHLIDDTGFPATSTLMGLGAYPTTHSSHLGMLGMHGTYEANMAMHDADLIIAVGARFDDRVTGKVFDAQGQRAFAPHARIIHMDVDHAEIGKIVPVDLALEGDATDSLRYLRAAWNSHEADVQLDAWWTQIAQWRDVKCLDVDESTDDIRAQSVLQKLGRMLEPLDDYIVSTNVGQHQMWAAQYLPFRKPRQLMTSGALGTMGYGLPAGIGAKIARPDVPSIVISGDGSWRMNSNETETSCRYDTPVKVIMLNNDSLNMVGQQQRSMYGGRVAHSAFHKSTKDFCAEFRAQGANARAERVSDPAEVDAALRRMMDYDDGPYFVQFDIRNEDCYPIVEAGRIHTDMKHSSDTLRRNPHLAPQ